MAENGEKTFGNEFIELYLSLPALEDVKSKECSNRVLREQQLLDKYRERELRRLKEMERSGAAVDDGVESTLLYFDGISCINDIEIPSTSRSTFQASDASQTKRKQTATTATDELLLFATDYMQKPQDVYQSTANVWGQKLSEMDRKQRILAEKLVNDIMFSGQLGLLDYNTSLANLRSPSRPSTPMSRSNSESLLYDSSLDSVPNYNIQGASRPVSTGVGQENIPVNRFALPPTPSLPLFYQAPPITDTMPIAIYENEQREPYAECTVNGSTSNLTTYYASDENN